MLIAWILISIGLFATVSRAQFGQSVETTNDYGSVRQAIVGEGYAIMGQSDSNRRAQPVGDLNSQVAYATNDKTTKQNGFGQGTGVVQADVNYGQGRQQYGQSAQQFGQGFTSPQQNARAEVGSGQYQQRSNGQSLPTLDRGTRSLDSVQQTSLGLGQETQSQALGQEALPRKLGQVQPSSALGQETRSSTELGQHVNSKQPDGFGQLRAKRYSNREPYRKSCNSYYGKYICYRLYEDDTNIPHDFTCWSTYLNKKNCTETENVLYLDRRNVEVDSSEVDRVFKTDDRSAYSDAANRQNFRTQDDEFGAIEKNMHGRRHEERRLPEDLDDRNVRVYNDRELRRNQRS